MAHRWRTQKSRLPLADDDAVVAADENVSTVHLRVEMSCWGTAEKTGRARRLQGGRAAVDLQHRAITKRAEHLERGHELCAEARALGIGERAAGAGVFVLGGDAGRRAVDDVAQRAAVPPLAADVEQPAPTGWR